MRKPVGDNGAGETSPLQRGPETTKWDSARDDGRGADRCRARISNRERACPREACDGVGCGDAAVERGSVDQAAPQGVVCEPTSLLLIEEICG